MTDRPTDFTPTALSPEGHAAKHAARLLPLRLLQRGRAPLLYSNRRSALRADWLELAGEGAPTLRVLLDEGALRPPQRFIGVDRDAGVVERCRAVYAHAPAVWHLGTFAPLLTAGGPLLDNVGIVVFDSTNAIYGNEIQRELDLLVSFARRQQGRLGACLLVVNAAANKGHARAGRGASAAAREQYRASLESRVGAAVTFHEYVSKRTSMLLSALCFGFAPGPAERDWPSEPPPR